MAHVQSLVEEGIDWKRLFVLAVLQGVVPLVHRALPTIGCVPEEVRDRFRRAAGEHTRRNLVLIQELVALLGHLTDEGIRAIPFKGPILALSLYGDLSLRKAGDLDILISPSDLSRAADLMCSLGYQVLTRRGPEGWPCQRGKYELRFLDPDSGISVELRWGLSSRPLSIPLPFDTLWERCASVELGGASVRCLHPEDLLMILCWHGCQHCWDRLMWVCDIAQILRVHPDLDWSGIEEQARALGRWRMVAMGLLLAGDLLDASLPEGIREKVWAEPLLQRPAEYVRRCLITCEILRSQVGEDEEEPGKTGKDRRRLHRVFLERRADRLRHDLQPVRRWVTPNAKDRAMVCLPEGLHFLYYLLRPLRLMGSVGPEAYHRLRRSKRWRAWKERQ
jgi:hypothetical protein